MCLQKKSLCSGRDRRQRKDRDVFPCSAAGTIRTLGIPVKMSDTPGTLRRPAPRLGEHTAEVLGSLQRAKKVAARS